MTKSLAVLVKDDAVVRSLEDARQALVTATSIHYVKRIVAVAAAGEVYARRQQLGEEAIGYAHAIKTEALARLGELLAAMPKATGTRFSGKDAFGGYRKEPPNDVSTLRDYGLTKKTSAVAQQLADLPEPVRRAIANRETTLTEARRQVTHAARRAQPLPEGKHRVLYADPPWQYRDTRSGLGDYAETAAEQHYPTLATPQLCALKIMALAHSDAVLFCWATFPLLPDALEVIAAWGFTYKTAFVWEKPRGSFGHYHKADAELLLLATRGSCTPDAEGRVSQILRAPREGHSRKPEAFRQLIQALYTHGPYLELFARRDAPGWRAWGNEPHEGRS